MWLKVENIYFIIMTFKLKGSIGITNGRLVETDKRFVVYLLKAPQSVVHYRGWLCGGAIISHNHVITSAACVMDVQHVYVISGYRKYVPSNRIDEDECIKRKKKKIIRTCMPNAFSMKHLLATRNDYWNWGDLMVALVDTPFDFSDLTYYTYCSYPPNAIEVNMLNHYEKNWVDVLSYGWGHAKYQRPRNDLKDYNEEYLRYSSGRITPTETCKKFAPSVFKHLGSAYSRFLLCVSYNGKLDERGDLILPYDVIYEDCNQIYNPDSTNNGTEKLRTRCQEQSLRQSGDRELVKIPGICQNDHGGPLTTWRGGKEILIGVASTYTTSARMECMAPYGYTSTHCLNKLIACALWPQQHANSRRFLNCDATPQDRSYYLVERNISWSGHPDGPAETERPRRSGPLNHGYDRL